LDFLGRVYHFAVDYPDREGEEADVNCDADGLVGNYHGLFLVG